MRGEVMHGEKCWGWRQIPLILIRVGARISGVKSASKDEVEICTWYVSLVFRGCDIPLSN